MYLADVELECFALLPGKIFGVAVGTAFYVYRGETKKKNISGKTI